MYRSSASSEASVAYAASGDFAGEIDIFLHAMKIIYLVFRKFMEDVEARRANFAADATAKF